LSEILPTSDLASDVESKWKSDLHLKIQANHVGTPPNTGPNEFILMQINLLKIYEYDESFKNI
jgi:hypothetical protein